MSGRCQVAVGRVTWADRGRNVMIVVFTDEEDCSTRDPELFTPSSATYGATDLNLRCFAHADAAMHPISRFVDVERDTDAQAMVDAATEGAGTVPVVFFPPVE